MTPSGLQSGLRAVWENREVEKSPLGKGSWDRLLGCLRDWVIVGSFPHTPWVLVDLRTCECFPTQDTRADGRGGGSDRLRSGSGLWVCGSRWGRMTSLLIHSTNITVLAPELGPDQVGSVF